MLHPDAELRYLISERRYGIFAAERIPKGTVIWTLDQLDRILSDEEITELVRSFGPDIKRYIFRAKGERVFSWDNARYMSNWCRANCLGTPYGFEVAVLDIDRDMELTRDCLATEARGCLHPACSSSEAICCRAIGISNDKRPEDIRKEALRDALYHLHSVCQPIMPLINASNIELAWQEVGGRASMQLVGDRTPLQLVGDDVSLQSTGEKVSNRLSIPASCVH